MLYPYPTIILDLNKEICTNEKCYPYCDYLNKIEKKNNKVGFIGFFIILSFYFILFSLL